MIEIPYVRQPVDLTMPSGTRTAPSRIRSPGSARDDRRARARCEPRLPRRQSPLAGVRLHRGEMPVTIGVFVDPGEPENRNVENDAFDDAYATFLLTEIIPQVRDRWVVSDDPHRWGIGGGSSGGSCASTVAWTRSDRFRRVLSFLGSFAQLRGGNRARS